MDLIRKDNLCVDLPIVSIANKGRQNMTVKCADPHTAETFETLMKQKYKDSVQIMKVSPTLPRVKITPIFTDSNDPKEVMNQLLRQNQWMSTFEFEFDALYGVQSRNVFYRTLILKCSDGLLHEMLNRKRIMFGMQLCRVYEQIDLLQCKKCMRYGHFARECAFDIVCRNCSKQHEHTDCNEQQWSCNTCINANKSGRNFTTSHKATDDRCASRMERVNAIKEVLISKN